MVHKFVGLGDPGEKIYLYKTKDKIFRQVLWGDWLKIDESHPDDEMGDGWLPVLWAPNSKNPQRVFIPEMHTTDTRPLEIIFLDVGQGDGLVLITPEGGQEERIIVMDAGEGRNMQAFLNGRFKAYRGFDFHAAVITHPDMDHYLGFKAIFADHDIGFRTIYHNGLVERPVAGTFKKLGGVFEDAASGVKYINEIAEDTDDIEELFSDSAANKKYVFPGVMHEAIKNPKINKFRMLSTHHGTVENNRTYMPGFAPADGREYNIEVLGPVVEFDSNANPRLRRISSRYGETKNGHSVILRLHYGDFKVLFGGDLNYPAEKFLLKHYTQRTKYPSKKSSDYKEMVKEARDWFGAEVMKVCHHGSEKVTDAFLESVNPACFVISSGDQEGHVHPRPDLLGRLGRFGRGESPVLLSTELQRSTREREDKNLVQQVLKEVGRLAEKPTDKLEKSLKANIYKLAKTNVEVYGAIYLKTDGKRLITAFKIEAKSDKEKWFYFEYAIDPSGELKLI